MIPMILYNKQDIFESSFGLCTNVMDDERTTETLIHFVDAVHAHEMKGLVKFDDIMVLESFLGTIRFLLSDRSIR